MKRNQFFKKLAYSAIGLSIAPSLAKSVSDDKPDQLNDELVREFVIAGHSDLLKVKQMLAAQPTLVNASYDWGGGDFETALGGAGHVGNVEIADYLLMQGARVNLFVLTMLGNSELVLPVLKAYSGLMFSKGPHGFSLMHHAEVGGKRSDEIKKYLEANRVTQKKFKLY